MIDPPKATKGRRMSKKTRKKSPKPAMGKTTRARSQTSAKTPASKTSPKAAAKSGKTRNKQTANAARSTSHKAPSKPLKSSRPAKPIPPKAAPASKAAAVKPQVAIPSAAKAAAKKPEAGNPPAAKKAAAPMPEAAIPAVPKASAEKAASTAGPKPALAEGAKAPAFQLPRDGGGTVSLADFSGSKLVLFFYPRADTPGCTREAIDFTRLAGAFAENRTTVLGVSADSPRAQEAFRNKHELSVPLVSDEQHQMLEAYGAWGEKSMYGRTFHGVLRTTVLIGADGRIAKIWRHVKVDGHADEVLAAVKDR
jgi:thioredoxin-dependent peroxiredoxin